MPRVPRRMTRQMLVTRRVEWALASLGRQWVWLPFRAESTPGARLGPISCLTGAAGLIEEPSLAWGLRGL